MPGVSREPDLDASSEDEHEEPELEFKDAGLNRIIIVDNLPVVTKEKYDKLVTVVKKIYTRIGQVAENGLHMPVDSDESTKGFAFIEFSTPQEALAAVEQVRLHGLAIGKCLGRSLISGHCVFLPDEWI